MLLRICCIGGTSRPRLRRATQPAPQHSPGSTGKSIHRKSPYRSQRRILDPRVRYDDIGGRIPITIFIKTGVKAVAVGDVDHLRELNFTVGRDFEMVEPNV